MAKLADSPLQPKLHVGPSNDAFEREADRVADAVVSGRQMDPPAISPLPGAAAQRTVAEATIDDESLQRATTATAEVEDLDVQRKKSSAPEEELLDSLQRDASSEGSLSAATESSIQRMRGRGRPLPDATRSHMQSRMGRDLGSVRIHSGGEASAAARALGARAFTVGNDVFFGAGEYRPESRPGQRLLAHELTHVVQQGADGRVQPSRIQRDPTDEDRIDPPTEFVDPEVGSLWRDDNGYHVRLIHLQIPFVDDAVKGSPNHAIAPGRPGIAPSPRTDAGESGTRYVLLPKTPRGSMTARRRWLASLTELPMEALRTLVGREAPDVVEAGGESVYYLALPGLTPPPFIHLGTLEELAANEGLRLPTWDAEGRITFFDADHAHELQLGGDDSFDNFWLWERDANQSSGRNINSTLRPAVMGLVRGAERAGVFTEGSAPAFDTIRASWEVTADQVVDLSVTGQPDRFWKRSDVEAGAHLEALEVLGEPALVRFGLLGNGTTPRHLVVFRSPEGGWSRRVERTQLNTQTELSGFFTGLDVDMIAYTPPPAGATPGQVLGSISGTPFRMRRTRGGTRLQQPFRLEGALQPLPLLYSPRFPLGAYVDPAPLRTELARLLQVREFSPVAISDAGIDESGSLYAVGEIVAARAIFPRLRIPIEVRGDTIRVDFPVPTDRLRLGPLSVDEASVGVLYTPDRGFALGGEAYFSVRGLGRGRLVAEGVDLTGAFDFDLDFLDPARVEVRYIDDHLSASATLGLREDTLPGARDAQIDVGIDDSGVSVTGRVTLAAGPLEGTQLTVSYDRETGVTIGAEDIPIPGDRLPGVESARASIFINRDLETGEWAVSGRGTAEFAHPGVTGELTVGVDGPIFTVHGEGEVEYGRMSGNAELTVTNQPTDEEGNPVDGEPLPQPRIFGDGEVTLQLGPILSATAGITYTETGSIEIRGTIALPPELPVFEERRFDRTLFEAPTIDIPIWGVSVMGQRVGIFLTIGGHLDFRSGVGPGVLRDTEVSVTYDPERPEDAHVHGQSTFAVPADAGLRLAINAGIAAGIPIVSAEAGLEVGAELGLTAEASAGVSVDWTPRTGLSLHAEARMHAEPRFVFDVSAYLKVGADLVLTEIDFIDERWTFFRREMGPELGVTIVFPLDWSETDGLQLSFDDITVERPEIDIPEMGDQLFADLLANV